MFGLVVVLSGIEWTHDLDPMKHPVNLMTIFCLSFCCGVQNSTCAIATDGFLKPTHMTGLSTDIGINLTRIWGEKNKIIRDELFRKNMLRISILFSFISGGVISGVIFSKYEHLAFIFPFLSSICFLMIGISRDIIKTHQSCFAFRMAKASLGVTFVLTLGFTFFGKV
jgi:uncharacterized membrane protein YoaK (UPF0700 family)